MPNLPPPLVLPLVSIMRRYGDLFSYSAIYCTAYHLKFIMAFPVAKLQTLHFVGFYQYYIRMHFQFSDPLDKTFSETFHSLEDV